MNLNRRVAKLVFTSLVLMSFLLLMFPVSIGVRSAKAVLAYIFIPSFKISDNSIKYFSNTRQRALSLLSVAGENKRLKIIIEKSKIEHSQLNAVLSENNRVAKLLDLKPRLKWKGVFAGVIARDCASWYGTIIINKGLLDGIQPADAVLAYGAGKMSLAGKII